MTPTGTGEVAGKLHLRWRRPRRVKARARPARVLEACWAVVGVNWRSRGEAGDREGQPWPPRTAWCFKVTEHPFPGLPRGGHGKRGRRVGECWRGLNPPAPSPAGAEPKALRPTIQGAFLTRPAYRRGLRKRAVMTKAMVNVPSFLTTLFSQGWTDLLCPENNSLWL